MRRRLQDAESPAGVATHPTTCTTPVLALAPHVRACRSGDRIVLLDLRTCRYIGVGDTNTPSLTHAIQGWPGEPPSHTGAHVAAADEVAVHAITRPLLAKGLLTNVHWLDMRVTSVEPATASLNADDATSPAPIQVARILRFLRAALLASLRLKHQSLLVISTRLQTADEQLRRRHHPLAERAIHDAVNAFYRLRPLVLTSKDRCLHDSLFLKLFLASEGIPSTWVVGVRTSPFAAHSWVQSGPLVLNDDSEHVRAFEPILIV